MGKETVRPRADVLSSRLICLVAYLVAGGAAVAAGVALRGYHPVLVAGVADVVATLVVFAFSLGCANSSLYDPYWSVAPVAIAAFWAATPVTDAVNLSRQLTVVLLVTVWSVRLTYNWLRRWKGLEDEDWRYVDLRARWGRAYWLVSLFGIHMFPTAIVFLGCFAVYPPLSVSAEKPGLIDGVALLVTAIAIAIEARADHELHRFARRRKDPGEFLSAGLWALSRHPNYFGEILFWWGLFLFALGAGTSYWWTVVGPGVITFMFVFVSVPLIDARMLRRRPQYAEQMQRLSPIVPWTSKKGGPSA